MNPFVNLLDCSTTTLVALNLQLNYDCLGFMFDVSLKLRKEDRHKKHTCLYPEMYIDLIIFHEGTLMMRLRLRCKQSVSGITTGMFETRPISSVEISLIKIWQIDHR